jgi:microcin C transport system substrate-binding protein
VRNLLSRSWLIVALAVTACGGGSSNTAAPAQGSATTASTSTASANKDDYPVFPNADAGADPAVPAEQGGRGFTGEGWETNTSFDLIGDPRAVKGGVLRQATTDFPSTLRYIGPNLSTWNQGLAQLVYEPLITIHPTTLEYMPVLASHWQVGADKMTMRFRIDPNARFSDGTPVTAEDVVATWKLLVDPTVQDPYRNSVYNRFEQPVAESKYIVRIKAKEASWTSLMYIASVEFSIYPAHVLKNVTGAAMIKEWNDKMLPGTGPYIVKPEDLEKGKAIHIRRRTDYWAEKYRRNIGLNNFDEIRDVVVRDRNLEFEMVKRGDLDIYVVSRAQMWVEELNFDQIQRGVMQKRKVWNHSPQSMGGAAFNTRRPPYDDVRVRKALRLLFNREQMIEKLMFNEYVPQHSAYPGSINENPNNEKISYNPQAAVALLAEAGWKDRNAQGQLVKNGRPMNLELLYYTQASERFYTIFQEDLRKVGINLNLRYVTPETAFKLIDERQFDMFSIAWGGGGPFPVPEQFWSSEQADKIASSNITGFKNARVDEIIKAYDLEFDVQKRAALLKELDGIVMSQHQYILEWFAPYTRVVYWNKFGQPRGVISRLGDARDAMSMWWIDPALEGELRGAMADPSKKMTVGASEDKYWLEFDKLEEQRNPTDATSTR